MRRGIVVPPEKRGAILLDVIRLPHAVMNRLLAALSAADFELLRPSLREIPLMQGMVLQEQESAVEQVYFPLGGAVSLISVMERGQSVETAVVGREGVIGAFGGSDVGTHSRAPLSACLGLHSLFQCRDFRWRSAKAITSGI